MRELIDDIRAIERAFAARLITPSTEDLKHHFNNPAVDKYLDEVAEHMLGNLDRFREQPPAEQGPRPPAVEEGARWFDYQVNVMVDNSATRGAPVVLEDAPTYRNLFGTIERWIDPLGRSGTNFTRIIGGSFLKSHGGFLVFDLEDAVVEPGVWKTLKRSLKSGRMTLETFEPLPFFFVGRTEARTVRVSQQGRDARRRATLQHALLLRSGVSGSVQSEGRDAALGRGRRRGCGALCGACGSIDAQGESAGVRRERAGKDR